MLRPPLALPKKSDWSDKATLIGQRVHLESENGALQIECTVTDLKQVFGRTCACVTPIAGTGSCWVNLPRISPITTTTTQEKKTR